MFDLCAFGRWGENDKPRFWHLTSSFGEVYISGWFVPSYWFDTRLVQLISTLRGAVFTDGHSFYIEVEGLPAVMPTFNEL